MTTRRMRSAMVGAWVATIVLGIAGCSSGGTSSESAPVTSAATTTTEAAPDETTAADDTVPDDAGDAAQKAADAAANVPAVPSGATEGLDDLDGDGAPDPTCGTADYGAGLVLRVPCEDLGLGNTPSEGVTLVERSLFAFPAGNYDLVADVTGAVIQARDADGKQVIVFFITADTLFEVGSAQLGGPAVTSMGGMASRIAAAYPGAAVQVRGHTDSTGDPATNQALSEQRAQNVADLLGRSGVDPSTITAVGLGSTSPIAVETNPDGSANEPGRTEDRRVEIVVRPAT